MRNIILTSAKLVLPVLALFIISITANAQKLPTVQKVSLRAPANIKIDGQAIEWNYKLQAYNNATDIAYTLSNDDKWLYLTVQSKYHDVVDKILRGGITLTINHSLKKMDEKHVSITYPVLRDADMAGVTNLLAHKGIEKREAGTAPIKVNDLNDLLEAKDKMINISGVESIPDPSISIYNNEGIKAASRFDSDLVYTCELAIPLKFLSLPNDGADAFSYQIKVNEPAQTVRSGDAPPPPPMMTTSFSPTYFWGEYTLAKK
ncbi:hypothetical protein [Mucilaginibacter sp.]|uniref:hypothetical protein n=1 Tax=Mucilaginibacter sp. TaxID=1882438 RepID=UPI002636051E|nr:hypothetical protein [Mucilaginibacter sp.]MDB4927049.1 hypothetical protein [Mucilaginibacter sp.]